jgi:hypothetical protein
MTGPEREEQLKPEFAATAAPDRVTVTLQLPADLAAWLKEQPLGLEGEIVSTMQFFRDASSQPVPPIEAYEAEFHTAGPDLVRDADRIERDFIP